MTTPNALSAVDQALIDRIKARIEAGTITGMQARFGMDAERYPPAPPEEITWAESGIGFALPSLIRELYLQVGNGGFGPGYGIVGLRSGMMIYEGTLVEATEHLRETKAYLQECIDEAAQDKDSGPDGLRWYEDSIAMYERWQARDTFIEYCYWGCNVTTVVDCGLPELPVYMVDGGDMRPHSAGTLRRWWEAWLDASIQQY